MAQRLVALLLSAASVVFVAAGPHSTAVPNKVATVTGTTRVVHMAVTPIPTHSPTPQPVASPAQPQTASSLQSLICSYPWDCATALRVAECESHFDPYARNGVHYGVFQEANLQSSDPAVQVQAAYDLYRVGGWTRWTCY